MTIDYAALTAALKPYLESLKNINFSYENPLFWVAMFVVFLIMTKFWGARKSFQFTFILSSLLLVTTAIEHGLASTMVREGEAFDPTIIRIIAGSALSFIILYFSLIKES